MFAKTLVFVASALAASVAAQSSTVQINNVPSSVTAGSPVKLDIVAATGAPYTVILRKGDSNNLGTIGPIKLDGTTWTPDSCLAEGNDYALEIDQVDPTTQKKNVNYSGQFSIKGGSGSCASSSASSAVTTASTLSSAARYGAVTPSTPLALNTTSSAVATSTAAPYVPPAGYAAATGRVGATTMNATIPTYTAPSVPSSTSESKPNASQSAKTTGGAAQIGSSLALVAGAVAAFAFLN